MCLSHLIYTMRPFLIHTCHAMPMPCSEHAILLKATTAVLCCGLEKNGMVGAWQRHGMTGVNQTRPHCVNQMGKTHSKPLAAGHGRGTAWARQGNGMGPACYVWIGLYTATCSKTTSYDAAKLTPRVLRKSQRLEPQKRDRSGQLHNPAAVIDWQST